MSIAVTIEELFDELERWGAAAVITVGDGGARVVTVYPSADSVDGQPVLRCRSVGRSAVANIARQPRVTLYFAPHPASDGYSLIVDGIGDSAASGDGIDVVPTSAVRHRPPPTP